MAPRGGAGARAGRQLLPASAAAVGLTLCAAGALFAATAAAGRGGIPGPPPNSPAAAHGGGPGRGPGTAGAAAPPGAARANQDYGGEPTPAAGGGAASAPGGGGGGGGGAGGPCCAYRQNLSAPTGTVSGPAGGRRTRPGARSPHRTRASGGTYTIASPRLSGVSGTSTSTQTTAPQQATGGGGRGTTSGAAAVASTAPAPAPAPAAPAPAASGAPPLSAAPSAPAARRRSARNAPAGGRGSARRGQLSASLVPLAQVVPAGPIATGAGNVPTGAPEGAGARASRPARHHRPSTLATTVTRIIDVVPLAVRIVIAALAALALALAVSSRLVALRARRLARQRRELLEDVGLLQAALLPALPSRLGPVGTSAAYLPAAGPGAGGDFYDVFALADGRLGVIVGDVSGHGREALPHTTLLRFTLRAYIEAGLPPRDALQAATPVLERQLGGSFATVVLACYDPGERTLVYAGAGHPPPIISGCEAITPLTVGSSPPIGGGQPTGRRQTAVSVPGRATVCFYTDGVVEARVGRELFGLDRLQHTLAELGPDANAQALLDRVAAEAQQHPDDMAACVLRIEGDASTPQVRLEEIELDGRDVARGRAERFMRAAGVEAAEIDSTLRTLRAAVARDGGAVLELRMARQPPAVALRGQDVAMLAASRRPARIG